jgi:hypothetical protein
MKRTQQHAQLSNATPHHRSTPHDEARGIATAKRHANAQHRPVL